MFFQISPVVHKKSKPIPQIRVEDDESHVEILSLALFTANPKIVFDNVVVGTTQVRKLLVKNPTGNDLHLFVKKSIPSELNLTLSWNEAIIPRGTEKLLELVWSPVQEEASRHTFTLSDGKRLNRNIGVTFKSILPKQIKASKGKKTTTKWPSVKLPLTRKPISPTKKLRPQKKSSSIKPSMNFSPPQRQYLAADFRQNCRQNSQQASAWENDKFYLKTKQENKENMSPISQRLLHDSYSFISPKNATFLMLNEKINERRETYILTPQLTNNKMYDLQNKLASESFYFESKESSLHFRDSLDSPNCPLREHSTNTTPTLEALLRKEDMRKSSLPNFDHNASAVYLKDNSFLPTIFSSVSKPPSTNNSMENSYMKTPKELFNNLSSETYVKNNISSETYLKETSNVSGGTFVKDSSIGDIGQLLDVSPVSSRTHFVPSPIFLKPSPKNNTEYCLLQNLSSIEEESSTFTETRTGTKRENSIFNNSPLKRTKLETSSRTDQTSFRVAKKTSGLNVMKYFNKENESSASSISETTTKTIIVRNPFLYANIIDPFMTSQIYCDEDWLEEQENNFKKWLNALLMPPEELNTTKLEVNVAQVWHDCTKKEEVPEASSKEAISLKYHTNKKLDYLRKQAQILFRSKEISNVLQKVCLVVETGKLSIRDDKDIHLNLKIKSDIIRLILGYNPLWLRLGLETIFNEIIPLKSNSDISGLEHFILENFLKDPHLIKKHKTIYAPKYSSDLKKFILKKFLILVYFLDRAKNEKLILHDPCLFSKNAIEKESKLVLIHFARETLQAVGDITKYLKCLGYVVSHAQSYIHEYDYAVKNLGVDLKDGVRLARVMEIIQMRNDLTSQLRVPAISRLQKIHNMKLVFKSLQESGYEILYDIEPKHIVDSQKEKTLSFLWQIIYKFEAPLMVKSAKTIQTWFRSLPVQLKRLKLRRVYLERENAAKRIQRWYRRQILAKIYFSLVEVVRTFIQERKNYLNKLRNLAAVIIQKNSKRYICRKRFLLLKQAALTVQLRFRAKKLTQKSQNDYKILKLATVNVQRIFKAKLAMKICRQEFLAKKKAAIKIQSYFRMYSLRKQYLKVQEIAIFIQRRYRTKKLSQKAENEYKTLKLATVTVQRRFRATMAMKTYREEFLAKKKAAIKIQSYLRMYISRKRYLELQQVALVIQRKFKAHKAMKLQRTQFLFLKQTAINIQRKFRANSLKKQAQEQYLIIRKATIVIQSYVRMHLVRNEFLVLKKVTIFVQNFYKAKKLMQIQKTRYQQLRNAALVVQQRWKAKQQKKRYDDLKQATINIQQRFRANKLMLQQKHAFLTLKNSVIFIQCKFRANLAARKIHEEYQKLQTTAIFIQRKYRAKKVMQLQKTSYQQLRNAVVLIQRLWRARQMCIQQKSDYQRLKLAAIKIQRRLRANKLMLKQTQSFLALKKSATVIQQRYKAKKVMQKQRQEYIELKNATVKIQIWYKSILTMRTCREQYILQKKAVAKIEQRYLEYRSTLKARYAYLNLQMATLTIQRHFKSRIAMKQCRHEFLELRSCTIKVQQIYRSKKLMQKQQADYHKLKKAAIFLQSKFRAQKQRKEFMAKKNACIKIQQWYRATIKMKHCRDYYQSLKLAVSSFEERYKAKKLMELERNKYNALGQATIKIQIRFKSLLETRKLREIYLRLKHAAIIISRKFRATIAARRQQQEFKTLKTATIIIQRRWRANVQARIAKSEYLQLKQAVVTVQRRYRANKLMQNKRNEFIKLKKACILVQKRYRAKLLMKNCKIQYTKLKWAVVVIQSRFRAEISMKQEMQKYQKLRSATFVIQRKFRATILAKEQRTLFLKFKSSIKVIQFHYRAFLLMKKQREIYLNIQRAALTIQMFGRGYLARKKYAALLTPEAREERRVLKARNEAAKTIQAFWKGYCVRKSNIPVMKALRIRKQQTATKSNSPCQGKTLIQRYEAAMLCITAENSSIHMLISALEDLDFITRHCQKLCYRLSLILPCQLYIIIMSVARSLPEMNASNVSTYILINFYKYPKTRENSWDASQMDRIITVLSHWCDKDTQLFPSLCTLLWLFGHEKEYKNVILALPNIKQRLSKIQTMVQRKQNMVLKSHKLQSNSVFGQEKDLKVPSTTADWGLDYKRPNTFTNSVFALKHLMKILDLF